MAAIMISVGGINFENFSCNKRGVHIWISAAHPPFRLNPVDALRLSTLRFFLV
jgi:hypothetical protein